MSDCEHDSAEGIDQTDISDPNKVWRCHECDGLFRTEPVPGRPYQSRVVNLGAPQRQGRKHA